MTSFPPTTPSPGRVGSAVADPVAVSRCPHCGTPVEGATDAYCCAGCELAAAIIRGAGLEAYYREREAFAPRPGNAPDDRKRVRYAQGRVIGGGSSVNGMISIFCPALANTPGSRGGTTAVPAGASTRTIMRAQ